MSKVSVNEETSLLPNNENSGLNPLSIKTVIFNSLKYNFVCFVWSWCKDLIQGLLYTI